MTMTTLKSNRNLLRGSGMVALAMMALQFSAQAQQTVPSSQPSMADSAVRAELEGDYERFEQALRAKDAAALTRFVQTLTPEDFQIRDPDERDTASPLILSPTGEVMTQKQRLLQELAQFARYLSPQSYTVQQADITLDKLVVFGDTALALTTGHGYGILNDPETQRDPSHPHWGSIKYRDCETWTKTPQGWKLREVYILVYLLDSWEIHEMQDQYLRPKVGF